MPADQQYVIAASVSPLTANAALRAVVNVADEAVDVAASEERILCVAVSGITNVLGDHCTVSLHEMRTGDLPATASNDPDPVQADLEDFVASLPLTSTVVYTADDPAGAWLRQHGLREAIVAPVMARGRTIGSLVVTRHERRESLSETGLSFVTTMADIIGISVQSSRMRNDAMVTLEDLRQQVEVTDSISDALIACDPSHLIVSWNSGAEQIYGYSRDEAVGCHLFTLLATQFYTTEGAQVPTDEIMSELAAIGQWRGELHERRADGAPLVVLSAVTQIMDSRGRPHGLVAVSRDITAQRREEFQAMHDPLTGLPNRRLLNSRLYEAVARACRTNETLAVLFIDLDGFKPINDTHGHAAGDVVLTATAQRLNAAVRHNDTVGRLGGDEFLIILEQAGTAPDITNAANRISAAVAAPIDLGRSVVTVLPSIGVCVTENPATQPVLADRLLEAADQAMYVAKRKKLGTVFVNVP